MAEEKNEHAQIMSKQAEKRKVEERLKLNSPMIYKIIVSDGHEELNRPYSSLIWSGIAAGLCISFSAICSGILYALLPADKSWELVRHFGYTIGFLMVIMGRLQLFTENTITAVLPTLSNLSLISIGKTLRLWWLVFLCNIIGTLAAALLLTYGDLIKPEYVEGIMAISYKFMQKEPFTAFVQGIPAGFILANLVWMLPSGRGQEPFMIILMTYIIALGDFSHVVAGSLEVFMVLLDGGASISEGMLVLMAAGFGNIVGGTGLFTLLAYAQIKEEL